MAQPDTAVRDIAQPLAEGLRQLQGDVAREVQEAEAVIAAEVDPRPGGSSLITMQGPDGTQVPNRGVYLEVVPNERIVFTDAYTAAWVPSAKPFFTGILTFEDEGGRTRYTARARHWSAEDCAAHAKMGFHEGWGVATDQLAALAATL